MLNMSIFNIFTDIKKKPKGIFQMLTEAYGYNCMSHKHVFGKHKRFNEGCDIVENEEHPI